MLVCPSCGQENPEGFRLCGMCGAPLVAELAAADVRKVVTVLFCDVAGYTSTGDRLDPEALRRLQSRYFDEARAALERHGATVEKFIGDAVMAVFGIPRLHEDDALRAVRAATELQAAVAALGLEARIGVNTGEVVAGGEDALVTGDAVNVASRLEEAARSGEILIGEETFRLVRDAVVAEPVAPLALKGKDEPVGSYRLVSVRPGVSGFARRLDSPLVGRERELKLLRDAFERVAEERVCQLFTLLGSAGVGKSRLADEFLGGARAGAAVVRGRCIPYGEGITFWPLYEVLEQLGEDERTRPVVELLGGTGAAPEELFFVVRKLLEAIAAERPLVAVIDDVHWAEPTFLDLVEHVADWSRDAPILLLCLARPELLDARRGWGGDKFNATSVLLEPLGEEESERLLENLVGGAGFPERARARITDAAEGNPLFVEELLAMLIDEGLLERRNGGWAATADLSSLRVPPTIQAILAARLDRLEASERAVIERAAVEGKVFHRGAVVELSPPELRPEVPSQLMKLVRRDLVRPDRPAFASEDAFRFRHLLIRDAAYEALPKETRAELHERFAAWLEAAGGGAVEHEEIVAYHLAQAYRYQQELGAVDPSGAALAQRAGRLYAAAGRRASTRGDVAGAVSLLRRAVDLLPAADPDGAEVLLDLGGVLAPAGDLAGAGAAFSDALGRADALDDRRLGILAQMGQMSFLTQSDSEGRTAELLRTAERAIPVFEELGDERGLASAWKAIADVHHMASRMGPRAEALERALDHARRGGDELGVSRNLGALAPSFVFGPTRVEEGIDRLHELRREARGRMFVEASCATNLAALEAMRGRFDDARELFSKAQTIYEELGAELFVRGISGPAWIIETLAEDHLAAEQKMRPACEYLQQIGEKGWLSTYVAHLGQSLYRLDRLDEAEQASRTSEEAGASDDVITQALWRQVRAKVLARRGDVDAGESLAREAIRIIDETDCLQWRGDARMDLAEVLRLAGRDDEADEAVREAIALYEQKGIVPAIERARALLRAGAD